MPLSDQQKRMVRRVSSHCYQVIGLPGFLESPEFASRVLAERWLEAKLPGLPSVQARRERPCLCCNATFQSEGAHNRLCNTCRAANADTRPYSFIRPSRRSA